MLQLNEGGLLHLLIWFRFFYSFIIEIVIILIFYLA